MPASNSAITSMVKQSQTQATPIGSPRAAINLGVGFLTEDRKAQGLVLPLSVKDNLCLPSVDKFTSFGFVDAKRERRAADRYVKELRIRTPGLDQKVVYLSGGNQQKVVLAKWLLKASSGWSSSPTSRGNIRPTPTGRRA